MKLLVKRNIHTEDSTIGDFFINGTQMCITLEDKDRALDPNKVYGNTAVPYGIYQVQFRKEGTMYQNLCSRFKDIGQDRGTLHISNIEGNTYPLWYNKPGISFDAWVLIHCGNIPSDTLGCLLVGMIKEPQGSIDKISQSEIAYKKIYPIIADALELGESVTIEYINGAA
jgi:hypothetical protein